MKHSPAIWSVAASGARRRFGFHGCVSYFNIQSAADRRIQNVRFAATQPLM